MNRGHRFLAWALVLVCIVALCVGGFAYFHMQRLSSQLTSEVAPFSITREPVVTDLPIETQSLSPASSLADDQ